MLDLSWNKQHKFYTMRAVPVSRSQLLTFQVQHYPPVLPQQHGLLRVVDAVEIVSVFDTFFPSPIDYRVYYVPCSV